MRDHPGTAGIVDEDVEPALGVADRGGEVFDFAGILGRCAARPVAGAGQARNQPVGRLGIAAKGDDDARPRLGEEARGRSPQALLPPVTSATRPSSTPMISPSKLSLRAQPCAIAIQKLPGLVWHARRLKPNTMTSASKVALVSRHNRKENSCCRFAADSETGGSGCK